MARNWWWHGAGAVLALGVALLLAGRQHLAAEHAVHPTGTPLEPAAAAATPGSGRFFDAVAPSYDVLNRLISLGLDQSWRRAAAAAAAASTDAVAREDVLDLAAGTGDLAFLLAETDAFGAVVALDPSEQMLARLRAKPRARGVRTVQGIAEELPFEDSRFRAVTVAFGVRNFANRTQGLREVYRVLKPGGRLVVLEASVPAGSGWTAVAARFFIQVVMPRVGRLVSGVDAYRYLRDSMAAFPGPEQFRGMLHEAGFHVLSNKRLWPFETGPDMYVAVKAKSEPPVVE
jgi:demethylmenaquinone methyltransferase / 2-methoxy-6-polyprenyl-1,4-benzoquinol methylase